MKARKGSSHGYDVTDPTRLNQELGAETDFDTLVRELRNHKMGLLLDIVPNHMAASPENPWWMDLMENGLCSPYASFFDIDWDAFDNRILLPILTRPYEKALENQELTLTLEDAGFFVQYGGYRLPLDLKSYRLLLSHCLDDLYKSLGSTHRDFQELNQLREAMEHLSSIANLNPEEAGREYRDRQAVKESFLYIVKASPRIRTALLQNISVFNSKKEKAKISELMHNLLEQQVYRLAYWKTAREHLNYRRFFDIDDLIGVRVEEPQVFEATHSLIFRPVREGKVSGLRIDHIDGLNDPLQYLCRLQHYLVQQEEETSIHPSFYILVEKILAGDETLPKEWPVFGTTGYDFLNTVNSLFVDEKGIQTLDRAYCHFTGSEVAFKDVAYQEKRQVAKELFLGEMNSLGYHLACLAQQNWYITDFSLEELTKALIEITAGLPIYRTYARTLKASLRDRPYLERAVQEAKEQNPALEPAALDLLKRVFLFDLPSTFSREQMEAWLHFVLRWQQLTGAIAAKGVEDTALYTYTRLVSLNEVGADPMSTSLSVEEFRR